MPAVFAHALVAHLRQGDFFCLITPFSYICRCLGVDRCRYRYRLLSSVLDHSLLLRWGASFRMSMRTRSQYDFFDERTSSISCAVSPLFGCFSLARAVSVYLLCGELLWSGAERGRTVAKQLSQLVDMFSTHLDSEDHQDQTAAGFLKELDNVLDAQHRKLANPSLQSQEIEEIVFDLLEFADDDGSVGQRLNRQYLLARCSYLQHMERREHKRKAKRQSQRKPPDEVENDTSIDATIDTAINRFANAIQLAGELADHLSLVALHFWLAKCYHQKSDHDRAYEEYAAAEQSLPQLSSNPSDPSFASALLAMRFTLNLRMASHEWERGRFSSGEQHIGVAHALLSQAQNSPALSHDKLLIENVLKEAFQVYWITSLFDYVGGRFIHAYRAGLLARDALSPETNPTNMGRCLRMVAEYRMNLVAAQCSFDPVDYPAFRLPGALQDSVEELDRTDEFMIAPLMDAAHKELKDAIAYARAGKDN